MLSTAPYTPGTLAHILYDTARFAAISLLRLAGLCVQVAAVVYNVPRLIVGDLDHGVGLDAVGRLLLFLLFGLVYPICIRVIIILGTVMPVAESAALTNRRCHHRYRLTCIWISNAAIMDYALLFNFDWRPDVMHHAGRHYSRSDAISSSSCWRHFEIIL
jgi:hypothetical protein